MWQPAANVFGFLTAQESAEVSHTLCNEFYINSFENDFVANNCNNCPGAMSASQLPPNFKMGYMETRRRFVVKDTLIKDFRVFFGFSTLPPMFESLYTKETRTSFMNSS